MDKLTHKQSLEYWTNPDIQNRPEGYLDNENTILRSQYLLKKIRSRFRSKNTSILELGCNSGRNLNALWESGYFNLAGIDINSDAIELMGRAYPALECDSYIGIFENILPKLITQYDLVFSMAALSHVHPDTINLIIFHMKRIAKKGIITIDFEISAKMNRMYPKDYKSLIEDDEWKLMDTEIVSNKADKALSNFTYRFFRK